MRIALLGDIHGNPMALDAVLNDAREHGVERYWCIGDYCAIGPEPALVVDRLAQLDGAVFVRGNTDRYVSSGDGPPPTLEAVRADPRLVPAYASIAASFAWTRGFLTAAGWLDWLDRLPLEYRFRAPSGQRILAVHAAPGTDDGVGVHPGRSNAELEALLRGTEEDIVIVGHTHEPMIRHVGRTVIVNTGSVSNPRAPDLRASYVVMESGEAGIDIEHRRVEWDHARFEEAVRAARHPAEAFILSHIRGEIPGRPAHPDHAPLARTRINAGR